MIPTAGQSLGSVVLEHQIAAGGMGSLWAAEHTTLRRRVVVKFASIDPAHPDAAARLEHEGRTIARIRSPFVPQVFDQGVFEDGTPFVVMELLEGIDLADWVAQHRPLDVEQVARLLDHVGHALAAAHEAGVVHRDVKPESIFVRGGGYDFDAKLIDFGIATSLGLLLSSPSFTVGGVALGSAGTMSPEQLISARDVDERSDLWSLGVVAYWCLTGRLPFESESFGGMCLSVHRGHFVPVSEQRPDLRCDLDPWFDKALAHQVDDRFQSAELMSKMFRVAASGHPLSLSQNHAPSTPPVALDTQGPMTLDRARDERKSPRRAMVAAALGTAMLAAVGALAVRSSPLVRVAATQPEPSPPSRLASVRDPVWSPAPPAAKDVPWVTVEEEPTPDETPPPPLPEEPAIAPLPSHETRAQEASAVRHTRHVSREPAPPPTGRQAAATTDWYPTDDLGEAGERTAALPNH